MLRVPRVLKSTALGLALSGGTLVCAATPTIDCLYAADTANNNPTGCASDPEDVVDIPAVAAAIAAVGVKPSDIQFVGCHDAAFLTVPNLGHSGSRYRIVYPVDGNLPKTTLVAPLTHEIGHVLQLSLYGSREQLLQRYHGSIDRIELGADFIAGIIFRNFQHNDNIREFQNDLRLAGSYDLASANSHGTPEARIAAFRTGFFYDLRGQSLATAHDDFQGELYSIAAAAEHP